MALGRSFTVSEPPAVKAIRLVFGVTRPDRPTS